MNIKGMNEILNDVIHTASQAILCDDEMIKRQAMGDIIDGLSSVIPAERAAGRSECDGGRVGKGVFSKIRSINGYTNVIAKANVLGRLFYADGDYVIDNDERYDRCDGFVVNVIEDKGEKGIQQLARIEFDDYCGSCAVVKMMRGFLAGVSYHYGKRLRRKANKKARLAQEINRELAATVARQNDDDELAQLIENA